MAILLGIDLETTGLDPKNDQIVEVGCVLWHTCTHTLLNCYSVFVKTDKLIPTDVSAINGITNDMLEYGFEKPDFISALCQGVEQADYLVAHNAEFEKSFLMEAGLPFIVHAKPWVDTKIDIPYQAGKGKGTLNDIAMCHGVFNPMPHRALSDTITMLQVLSKYDFTEVERYAQAPNVTLSIKFPYDETGAKNKAVKSLGYYWKSETKTWERNFKEFQVEAALKEARDIGFVASVRPEAVPA